MVTLSSPRVGDFLAANFVSAYQQKGDFEVTQVRGNVQKNGGNVVSYFCTPDLRVVHLVVGPVAPDRFLAEASFAHDAYQAALGDRAPLLVEAALNGNPTAKPKGTKKANKRTAARDVALQRQAVAAEHLRHAGGNVAQGLKTLAETDRGRGKGGYYKQRGMSAAQARWESLISGTHFFSAGGDRTERVHVLFAYDPLPLLTDIDTAVFRTLAGQHVNDQNGSVATAVAQVERAMKAGRPVMFVFYKDWHAWRMSRNRAMLQKGELPKLIRQFEVVNLPTRELPALSSQLPGFEVPDAGERATATIVIADCRRARLATVSDQIEPASFGLTLQKAIEENGLARAMRLAEEQKPRDAKRLLTKATKSKRPEIVAKAEKLLAEIEGL